MVAVKADLYETENKYR